MNEPRSKPGRGRASWLLAAILTASTGAALAEAPLGILYQGRLKQNGTAVSGAVPVTLRLTSADGSSEYWTSGPTSVVVSSGSFRYMLGAPNEAAFKAIDWNVATPYVELTVNGTTLLPRERLSSTPYALLARGLAAGATIQAGALDMAGNRITTVAAPAQPSDAATKAYVDAAVAASSGATPATVASAQVAPGSFQSGTYTFPGALNWGDAGSRTDYKDDAGAAASRSGFFQTAAPLNYYSGASSWQHLIEARHSNPNNNYALQIAGSFFDQSLYFRKTNNSAATPWSKLVAENSAGNVGIGTASPGAKLEVQGGAIKATGGLILPTFASTDAASARPTDAGAVWLEQSKANLAASGGVHLGNETACNAAMEGTIRYSKTARRVELCDGSQWQPISVVQQITQQIVQQAPQQTPPPLSLECHIVTETATQAGWFGPWCPPDTTMTGGGALTHAPPPGPQGEMGWAPFLSSSGPYYNAFASYATAAGDVAQAVCCKIATGK